MTNSRVSPDQSITQKAVEFWELKAPPKLLRMVENFVYETFDDDGKKILRLTEPKQRQYHEIEAELDWIEHLSQSVEEVVKPIASNDGRFVRELNSEDQVFFATMFEYADGDWITDAYEMSDELYQSWGRLIAKLHKATKSYAPGPTVPKRKDWKADRGFLEAKVWAKELGRLDQLRSFESWLESLPQTPDVYGLVHRDAHYGNFHVNSGNIKLFDFDDSCYHWFAFDLAVTLVHLKYEASIKSKMTLYDNARRNIISGYLSANAMDQIWLDRIDTMLNFHMLVLNFWCYGQIQKNEIGEKGVQWCRDYVNWFSNNQTQAPKLI